MKSKAQLLDLFEMWRTLLEDVDHCLRQLDTNDDQFSRRTLIRDKITG